MRRVQLVLGHLAGSPPATGTGTGIRAAPCGSRAGASPRAASPDDVVVVHGRRTAIGRAKRGGFKDTTPDELLSAVMTAVLQDVNLRPEVLGDICVDLQEMFFCSRWICCSLLHFFYQKCLFFRGFFKC
uniref:acetyl-CoA C-acetyltransferase n=1 Tax=Calidris pygmaea TaxID=425635 RepID=A0A8C3JYA8_9CHAR